MLPSSDTPNNWVSPLITANIEPAVDAAPLSNLALLLLSRPITVLFAADVIGLILLFTVTPAVTFILLLAFVPLVSNLMFFVFVSPSAIANFVFAAAAV